MQSHFHEQLMQPRAVHGYVLSAIGMHGDMALPEAWRSGVA